MFKKAKRPEQVKPSSEPDNCTKTAAQIEAGRAIARGERIKQLSTEAEMWRRFSAECQAGRMVYESTSFYPYSPLRAQLVMTMDADSAPLWAAFAISMADERERRLKDVLGV